MPQRVPGVVRLWRLVTARRKAAPGPASSRPVRYGLRVTNIPRELLAQYVRCCQCQTLVVSDYSIPCDVHWGESMCLDCVQDDQWC